MKPAADKPDASSYDAVVVGSGVRAGTWHAPVREWVKANAATLKTKPLAMFTVGLMITDEAKRDEVAAYNKAVIEENSLTPIDTGLFAGWNEPKAFSFPERMIMKVMKAPQGDFRDMAAISAWTESVAPQLGVAVVKASAVIGVGLVVLVALALLGLGVKPKAWALGGPTHATWDR